MTTDITELAQREKFEAWAEERCALPWGYLKNRRTNTGYFSKHDYTSLWAAWKAAGAELVEALEKAQQRIAELESCTVTAAAADVLAERKRQVTTEGWTPEHDDQHVNFEMAIAGGLYAISAVDSHHKLRNSAPSAWPWDRKWWKPDGPRRDLVKAGALILAEIERLDRAAGIKVEAE
ncbi:ead/Ea22-like family protein [Raoultella ornithinolytica]|uniref:ead/Ea22-like family protein n=1 Tax=Raoultella ornithinolytica TaxID=54291 RepID=UPI001F2ACF8B|nr:ead/Ea22-like family protein [Raoultella ornithinolytica]